MLLPDVEKAIASAIELALKTSINGGIHEEDDPGRPSRKVLVLEGDALVFIRADALKTLGLADELNLGNARAMASDELARKILHYSML